MEFNRERHQVNKPSLMYKGRVRSEREMRQLTEKLPGLPRRVLGPPGCLSAEWPGRESEAAVFVGVYTCILIYMYRQIVGFFIPALLVQNFR